MLDRLDEGALFGIAGNDCGRPKVAAEQHGRPPVKAKARLLLIFAVAFPAALFEDGPDVALEVNIGSLERRAGREGGKNYELGR